MSTPATYFNEREHQICLVARMVGSHAEMMDKLVGYQRIKEITGRATIKEGYGA